MVNKSKVEIRETKEDILTYKPCEANKVPMFIEKKAYQGASGKIYPIPFTDRLCNEPENESYTMISIENEYVKVQVLPEIGGKIQMGYDKMNDYHFIYHNNVIKPAMIGLAGPWVSGGIEFNWPQHHRPTTFMPVSYKIEENDDGSKTVWMGEIDPLCRQKGMVGITLYPGKTYIKAKVKLYNRTNQPQNFMWWANLAVHINEEYRVGFPPDLEYVSDHDRRAMISYPEMKGIFHTARPYDYGEGKDASWLKNIFPQTSIMAPNGGSEMNFMSGYDYKKDAGIVHVANHHISPGKKLFTWGNSEFGRVWQENLTDDDGPYVELMTGVYTDNQPDFAWIMPYETKEFEQYWYPVSKIGKVSNATIHSAVSLELNDNNARIGFCVTGEFKNATAEVRCDDKVIFSQIMDIIPEKPFVTTISVPQHKSILVSLADCEGKELVSYCPVKQGLKKIPEPRAIAKDPKHIGTVEELYINGLHLEQYKHHTFEPDAYYEEGLRRDIGDIRCNISMGRLNLKYGKFESARQYFLKAEERLISRNTNPYDVEVYYYLGLVEKLIGNRKKAYEYFYKAAWHYGFRSAAYYEIAKMDIANGDFQSALEHIETSLSTNVKSISLNTLKAIILRKMGKSDEAMVLLKEIQKADRLDISSKCEEYFITRDVTLLQQSYNSVYENPEYMIDLALTYIDCRLFDEAVELFICKTSPMVNYYIGYVYHIMGQNKKALEYFQLAEKSNPDYCFPCRLESISVLQTAIKINKKGAKAYYYLGNLYYDKFRYDEAVALWEISRELDDSFYIVHRNLGVAYFEKMGDYERAKASMEKAFELGKDCRVLFELQQLYKRLGVNPQIQLDLLEQNIDLVMMRDDCYLEMLFLYTLVGNYEKTVEMLEGRRFNIYEGGEGKLTKHHGWVHTTIGNIMARDGRYNEAIEEFEKSLMFPKNYGEGRSYMAQEAHTHYFMGLAFEKMREFDKAKEEYEKAAAFHIDINEISYYEGLALIAIGKKNEAGELFKKMIHEGTHIIENAGVYGYYGVGMPIPQIFENDIARVNTINGLLIKWMGYYGLGEASKAKEAYDELMKMDPNNMKAYFINQNMM